MPTATVYPSSNVALAALPGGGFAVPLPDGSYAFAALGFTNPNNAHAAGDGPAYATGAPANHRGVHSVFSFASLASEIPAGATINSAQLQWRAKYSTTSSGAAASASTWATHNGTGTVSNQIGTATRDQPDGSEGNAEFTTDTTKTHTFTPTAAQLRDSGFAALIFMNRSSLVGITYSLDWLALVIDYTPAAASEVGSGDVVFSPTHATAIVAAHAATSSRGRRAH